MHLKRQPARLFTNLACARDSFASPFLRRRYFFNFRREKKIGEPKFIVILPTFVQYRSDTDVLFFFSFYHSEAGTSNLKVRKYFSRQIVARLALCKIEKNDWRSAVYGHILDSVSRITYLVYVARAMKTMYDVEIKLKTQPTYLAKQSLDYLPPSKNFPLVLS